MLLWGFSLITIKWDQGEFRLKIGKWITLQSKIEKVIWSKSSIKLCIEKKYAVDLIPEKS